MCSKSIKPAIIRDFNIVQIPLSPPSKPSTTYCAWLIFLSVYCIYSDTITLYLCCFNAFVTIFYTYSALKSVCKIAAKPIVLRFCCDFIATLLRGIGISTYNKSILVVSLKPIT